MALGAIAAEVFRREIIFVGVFMAGQTPLFFESRPFINTRSVFLRDMTFGAGSVLVFPGEFIFGVLFMVETELCFPCFESMTNVAVFDRPFGVEFMRIVFLVTGHATCVGAQIMGLVGAGRFFGLKSFFNMAVDAY